MSELQPAPPASGGEEEDMDVDTLETDALAAQGAQDKEDTDDEIIISRNHDGVVDWDEELAKVKENLKKDFEKERDEIIAQLPESYSSLFGQIGFTKYQKLWYPVLILHPYRVPPGPIRDQWLEAFQKLKKQERLGDMTCLVYWFGTANDERNWYGFLERKSIILYEDAIGRSLDKDMMKAKQKKDEGKNIKSGSESVLLNAFLELEEELKKPPNERIRPFPDFKEGYELMEVDDIMADDAYKPSPVKAKGKGKKRRRNSVSSHASKQDEEDQKPKKKQKGKGKTDKLGSRKRSTKAKRDEVLVGQQEEPVVPENVGQVDDMDFADRDESIGDDDEKDDDFGDDESDEEDEDFVSGKPDRAAGKKSTRRKSASSAKKEKPVKQPKKEPKDASKQGTKRGSSKATSKDPMKLEKKALVKCNEKYGPLLEKWTKAVVEKDGETIRACMELFMPSIEEMCASFMKVLADEDLLGRTKKCLQEMSDSDTLLKKLKEVKKSLGECFKSKMKDLPPNVTLPSLKSNPRPSIKSTGEQEGNPKDRDADLQSQRNVKPVQESGDSVANEEDQRRSSAANREEELVKQAAAALKEEKARQSSLTAKVERKSFSLGQFGKQFQKEEKVEPAQGPAVETAYAFVATVVKPQNAFWLTDETVSEVPIDDYRKLAVDFFRHAALELPTGKVNSGHFAVALEKAVHEWAEKTADSTLSTATASSTDGTNGKNTSYIDVYWGRVHALTAAISGKLEPGTVAHLIAQGKYPTAAQVAEIPEEDLLKSFEGEALH